MIQDYPQLVKYFAAKNPFHLFLMALPLWMLAAYGALASTTSWAVLLSCFLAGVFYWSFLEYAIHRWPYHSSLTNGFLKYFLGSFHQYHHQVMKDYRVLNAGFLMVYVVTPIILSPLLFFTRDLSVIGAVTLGLISAHTFYEWVHYTLHLDKFESGYLGYIQRYHFHHHDRAPLKNFGNTSHLWDVLLGTYDPDYKHYVMPESTRRTLIRHAE